MSGPIKWDIHREGRTWTKEEFESRWACTPEKFELWDGKMLFYEEDRINLLGICLEQVGIDKAIRLGDPVIWEQALLDLKEQNKEGKE